MIPKVIHYCWFGGKPLPELAARCIASWRKYLPDFEIKEWNESNFDVRQIPYVAQAYERGKYAFVSDYARFKIIHEQGGIYFDTDVEVIKPLDDILAKGAFFGIEASRGEFFCAPGLGFACPAGFSLCKEMCERYESMDFVDATGNCNLKTVVRIMSELLLEKGFAPSNDIVEFNGAYFYPPEYFCPVNYYTGEKNITVNTRTIHHYAASWVPAPQKLSLPARMLYRTGLQDTGLAKVLLDFYHVFKKPRKS